MTPCTRRTLHTAARIFVLDAFILAMVATVVVFAPRLGAG